MASAAASRRVSSLSEKQAGQIPGLRAPNGLRNTSFCGTQLGSGTSFFSASAWMAGQVSISVGPLAPSQDTQDGNDDDACERVFPVDGRARILQL